MTKLIVMKILREASDRYKHMLHYFVTVIRANRLFLTSTS